MLSLLRVWWPLVIITAAGAWLRTHDLARRPMHADEANQAVKLGELLDSGRYTFDPRDHHGPTLYYLALPFAWARGESSLAALTETTVRLVPAVFGTIAIALLGILVEGALRPASKSPAASGSSGPKVPPAKDARLGPHWPAMAAATFFALAPPAVYYSRYFIQETLLLTFTLGAFVCARAWWRRDCPGWAAATGVCLGLMQATKASAPLFVVAALVAVAVGLRAVLRSPARPRLGPGLLSAAAAALVVLVVFYSSFFTHLTGLRDALSVYTQSGSRISSGATGHEKPWWYYAQLLALHRAGGLTVHQLPLCVLAVAGIVIAFLRRDAFLRTVSLYLLLVGVVFSALAYKTPWHAVHLVPALCVLAAGTLAAMARLRTGKLVALAFTVGLAGTLYQQTALSSFKRPADARNPYAYVHSAMDVLKFRPLADAALVRTPGAPIRVIADEYWPLPWYFRGLANVGYWSAPPPDSDGALVIASIAQADAVRASLRGTYRESLLGLRPGVLCVVFAREP